MAMVVVILGICVMYALCEAHILLPVHIILRLVYLMFFCMLQDNGQAEGIFQEENLEKKLSHSKKVRVIRIVLIISFFVLLWPYKFAFPSIQEIGAGLVILIPVSLASNCITAFHANNELRSKSKILLAAKLTASDILHFCLIAPAYYACAFLAFAFSS